MRVYLEEVPELRQPVPGSLAIVTGPGFAFGGPHAAASKYVVTRDVMKHKERLTVLRGSQTLVIAVNDTWITCFGDGQLYDILTDRLLVEWSPP